MNTKLTHMAAAVLALSCMAGAHAQSSVTLYGLVDVGLEHAKAGGNSATRVISGGSLGSRLGFRGVEDLGGGLSAIFRLESGLNADNGSYAQGGLAFGREASVGLSSRSWGTLSFGRQSSPYYAVLPFVDAFFWEGAGGILGLTRSATATTQILPLGINGRPDNSIGYVTPNLGGFEGRLMYATGEKSATMGNTTGASVRYNQKPVDVVLGYTELEAGTAGTGALKAAVVGGSFDFGPAKVYAGYTREQNNCSNCTGAYARPAGVAGTNSGDFRIINLGTRLPFGAFTAIAQVAKIQDRSQYTVNPGNRDGSWFAIGGEYTLSKRTMFYSTLGTIKNRNGSQYAPGTGSAQASAGLVPAGDPRVTVINVGMRHSF